MMISMRSTIVAAAAVTLLLYGYAARAAQIGGLASSPGPGGLAVSTTIAYSDRDVENGSNEDIVSRRVLFRADFGLLDSLTFQATVGFTDIAFDQSGFDGRLGESFGGGIRYEMLEFPKSSASLVTDLQGEYFRSKDADKKVEAQSYQVSTYVLRTVGAGGKKGYFYPYGGVRVSYALYKANKEISDHKGDNMVGIFGGADYFVNPNVFFSGEVHLFDEMSVFVGVGYRF